MRGAHSSYILVASGSGIPWPKEFLQFLIWRYCPFLGGTKASSNVNIATEYAESSTVGTGRYANKMLDAASMTLWQEAIAKYLSYGGQVGDRSYRRRQS